MKAALSSLLALITASTAPNTNTSTYSGSGVAPEINDGQDAGAACVWVAETRIFCAGIPVVIAIGAPSSLAIEMADSSGVILIGFVKATGFNVYSGETRLKNLT